MSGIVADAADRRARPVEAGARGATRRWSAAKRLFDAVPAEALTDFTQFSSPAVFARRHAASSPARAGGPGLLGAGQLDDLERARSASAALLAGAQLLHYYPVSTVIDGQGLNITVQSYLDTLDFGLVA